VPREAPPDDYVAGTLLYQARSGATRSLRFDMKRWCRGMLYYGPVRVPTNAVSGNAIIRCQLPSTSKFQSVPTEIPVEIR